jgi:outer membrane usher protein
MLSLPGGGPGPDIDLSIFQDAGGQAPGKYQVDIYINDQFYTTRQVNFVLSGENALEGELTPTEYQEMGVDVDHVPGFKALPPDQPVKNLAGFIPSATSTLDFSRMRLMVSIPQASMRQGRYGVDPQLWQQGIPAFLLNYNLNGSHGWRNGQGASGGDSSTDNMFASFMTGLNLGAWRARSNMTWTHSRQADDHYDSPSEAMSRTAYSNDAWTFLDRYVERDLQALTGKMTLGDMNTGQTASQVFDGFPFRGMRVMSNDEMRSDVMNSFAPVVSGMVNSNAQVTVRQRGNVIYQSWVPPGPFRLTDIAGGGAGEDLVVTIKEADGTERSFTQAYSSVPVMQREGQLKYEVSTGRYRQSGLTSGTQTPVFAMATMIYGLPHNVTAYGGGVAAHNYLSGASGLGVSMGSFGAASADVTYARTQLPGDGRTVAGQAYRLRYAKKMLSTGTNLDLSVRRYSSRDFYNFQDANAAGYSVRDGLMPWINDRRRSNWQMRLDQPLPGDLSLSLGSSLNSYWDNRHNDISLNAGLSGSIRRVSWGLNYTIDHIRGDNSWPQNRQLSLNVNVPLSVFSSSDALKSANANYIMTHDSEGRVSNRVGMSGALADNALNWNVAQSEGNQPQDRNSDMGMSYSSRLGSANLGYSHSPHSHTVSYGLRGGLLAHQYGVTLAQSIDDSVALVHAPNARNVKVTSGSNITTDRWGNAVVSNLQNYRLNSIGLDPSTLPEGVDLKETSKNVYPTDGAVVLASYKTRTGRQVLFNLTHGGRPVPFGAVVSLKGDELEPDTAIVGDDGQVYMSGMADRGELEVYWGDSPDSRCHVTYHLEPAEDAKKTQGQWTPLPQVSEVCH